MISKDTTNDCVCEWVSEWMRLFCLYGPNEKYINVHIYIVNITIHYLQFEDFSKREHCKSLKNNVIIKTFFKSNF